MARLKLFLFGPPRVELDGTAVDIQRRKALALLIYMAVSGQPHSRDALATLFYPDHSQSRARSYLRRDLAILNTGLEGEWLVADRDTAELKPGVWLDVDHFRRVLADCQTHAHPPEVICPDCVSLLGQAVTLYTDDFLAGFTLRDSPDFDDWQFFQTESLRQELASALQRLVLGLANQGSHEAAIPHARRWVSLDPLHELAQRSLIQLYDQAGQPAAALRRYEEYVQLLEEELGLPPEEETTTLYEAIKAKRMLRPHLKAEDQGRKTAGSKQRVAATSPQSSRAPTQSADSSNLDRQTILAQVAQHRAAEEYAVAIDLLKPLLTQDSADEAVHRELMWLYTLAGRRHEALRQYQACLEALALTGAVPASETDALYRQIVNGKVAPAPTNIPKPVWSASDPIAAELKRSAPLVGREEELESLQVKIRASSDGRGCTILLAGESGVGKTRLAYEALQTAALARMTTLVGAAYEQECHLPYQPFIEAFDRYLAEQQRPAEQHPITHYQPLGSSDLQQEHTALFKATASFLTALATGGSVILMLDDLHAADEASLSLFHYLARQTQSAPIVLLATYRTDVAVNAMSPFGSLLNALYREHLGEVLHLKPLPESAGAKIINHTLGGETDSALIKSIVDIAEGNPFFVQEITRAMLKSDGLVQNQQGQWSLRQESNVRVPTGLQELLRERVQRLGPTVETTLTTAAVIGREFRFTLLRLVIDLADGELLDALDAALAGQLLDETEEGYRFHHSLIRHTLYDGLSRMRRTLLHRRVAEAIEATYAAGPEGLKPYVEPLAFHYNLSDQPDRALPYLLQAGQKAADIYALELATDYYERALALINALGYDDPAQRWAILTQLGEWAFILANSAQAVARFEEALALTPTDDWQPSYGDRVRVHSVAARTLLSAGQAALAEQHLQAAMEVAVDSGQATTDYARLLYDVSLWYWHRNEYQEAFEVAQRCLDIAKRLNNKIAIARAYEVLALACHSLGDWQQGLSFEAQRAALVGPDLDVTEAFDVHL